MYKFLRSQRVINIYGKKGFCTNPANLSKNKYSGLLNGLRELEKLDGEYSLLKQDLENRFYLEKKDIKIKMNQQLNWVKNQKYNNIFDKSEKENYNEMMAKMIKENVEKKIKKVEEEKNIELRNFDEEYWKKMEEQNKKIEGILPSLFTIPTVQKKINDIVLDGQKYRELRENYCQLLEKYRIELYKIKNCNCHKEIFNKHKGDFFSGFNLISEELRYDQLKEKYDILNKRYLELESLKCGKFSWEKFGEILVAILCIIMALLGCIFCMALILDMLQ